MRSARIDACTVAQLFDDPESVELFAEYAGECANPVSGAPLPGRQMYETLERCGGAQCYAATVDGGRLRGFALVLKTNIPEAGMRFATVERMFVAQGARDCGLGTMLMHTIDADAKDAGCESIYYSAPAYSQLNRLLAMQPKRYELTSRVYTRKLQ